MYVYHAIIYTFYFWYPSTKHVLKDEPQDNESVKKCYQWKNMVDSRVLNALKVDLTEGSKHFIHWCSYTTIRRTVKMKISTEVKSKKIKHMRRVNNIYDGSLSGMCLIGTKDTVNVWLMVLLWGVGETSL